MKSYNKVFVFFVARTLKIIKSHSLKLAKVFPNEFIPFKANKSLYSNASYYSGVKLTLVKIFSPS